MVVMLTKVYMNFSKDANHLSNKCLILYICNNNLLKTERTSHIMHRFSKLSRLLKLAE